MRLRILKGFQAGTIRELTKKTFSVGREPDNDFVVPEPEISRHHCLFTNFDDDWTLQDLQSQNGVAVNGKKITGKQVLREGDEITLFKLVLRLEDETRPLEAEPTPQPEEKPAGPGATAPSVEHPECFPIPQDPWNRQEEPAEVRLPNPLELIVPVAKGLVIIVILAAIGVLLYLILTGEPAEQEQTRTEEQTQEKQLAQEEQLAQAAQTQEAGAETPQDAAVKPKARSPRHARGEELIREEGSIVELNAEAVPPPPQNLEGPEGAQPERLQAEETETDTQQDDGKPIVMPLKDRVLVVRTVPPGASVALNGQFIQRTPAVLQNLEDEEVSLEIQLRGYERKTMIVNLEEGLPQDPIRLVPKVGTLTVESTPPGALVSEGRIVYGTTPLTIPDMAAGSHQLILERKDCEPQKLTVEMTEAKGESITATLKQTLGAVEITSIPPNCKIMIDGLYVGTTEPDAANARSKPLRIDRLMPGPCAIRILHPETGAFDAMTGTVPQGDTARYGGLVWIPTHKVVLANQTTLVGMLMKKSEQAVTILTPDNKQKTLPAKDCAELIQLSTEDQNFILKQRASGDPSGQLSTKSKLSIRAEDFLKQANFPAFRGYLKSKICITGKVTMRMKTPRGTVVHFGKQIRCFLTPSAPPEDYREIGRLEDAGKPVSLRGTYEGEANRVFVFSNCVLLPYPD